MNINYTNRLDSAIKVAAWAHQNNANQNKRSRKGTDTPYIIHPFAVMTIASSVTDDEDTLIACLLHDILEDVDNTTYSEQTMRKDFGDRVVSIVKDVTKDDTQKDWHKRSLAYLEHLENKASAEAVIVSAADKIHNLLSTLADHEAHGDNIWQRFTTKSSNDQLWWYKSILNVITKREVPKPLIDQLDEMVVTLQSIVQDNAKATKT